jgi:hypothetical protein
MIIDDMFIIDFLVKSVFVYLRNYGGRGLEASLIPISMFLSLIFFFITSFIFYSFGTSLLIITEWGIGILVAVYYFVLRRILSQLYIGKKRDITIQGPVEVVLYSLLGILFFVCSILLGVMSLRFF